MKTFELTINCRTGEKVFKEVDVPIRDFTVNLRKIDLVKLADDVEALKAKP